MVHNKQLPCDDEFAFMVKVVLELAYIIVFISVAFFAVLSPIPTRCTEWAENTQTRPGTLPLASAPPRWDWYQVFEFVSLSIIVVTLSDKKLSSSDHGLFYFSCTKLSHQVPTTPPPTPPDFERCHAGVSFVFYYLYCSDYWLLFKCLIDFIYLYCSDYPLNLSLTYSMLSFLQRLSYILFGTKHVVYFVIFWHP